MSADYIIPLAILIFAIYMIARPSKSSSRRGSKKSGGGCKYCGGTLRNTSRPGYSFTCKDCGADIV